MEHEDLDLSGEFISLLFEAWTAGGQEGEPSSYLRSHRGQVAVYDQFCDDVPVGLFEAVFIDFEGAATEGVSPFDVFDHTQATIGYFEELYGPDESGIRDAVMKLACGAHDYIWSPNLLIIQRLIINPQFRGHGLGLAAMRALILTLRAGAGLVAIKPFPLQFEAGLEKGSAEFISLAYDTLAKNERTATAKLRRLYGKLGFRLVPKTPYMVLDAQKPLPDISELSGREDGPGKRHKVPLPPAEP